jgi:hypothetical protein
MQLTVVLDEWAQPPAPEPPLPPRPESSGRPEDPGAAARRQWRLDAMLTARILVPGPLVLVTGI